jgi:transposase
LKVRETLVGQRTLLVNTLRGHAAEFGVIAAKGLRQIDPLLAAIDQDTAIPSEAKTWPHCWVDKLRTSTQGSRNSMSN